MGILSINFVNEQESLKKNLMKSLKYEVFLILIIFDTYYIPTKYPNGLPDGIPAEVYTEEIVKFVK